MRQTDSYVMKFEADGIGEAKLVEFRAEDASEALLIARNEAANRNVELWKGNTRLCRLCHDNNDVWTIG